MSSEEILMIAKEPFIRKFTLAMIKSIEAKKFSHEERHVIHADLVPKVSKKVAQASLREKVIVGKKGNFVKPRGVVPPVPHGVPHGVSPPNVSTGLSQDYGKVSPLLDDSSVSTIECSGQGRPLMIIRAGQKELTKVVLSAEDIKEILDKVSEAAHIPLLDGVFRAAVDNFSINAVISDVIGSRFVIKKQNAYSLLERQG
jgi:hypothetical protein